MNGGAVFLILVSMVKEGLPVEEGTSEGHDEGREKGMDVFVSIRIYNKKYSVEYSEQDPALTKNKCSIERPIFLHVLN